MALVDRQLSPLARTLLWIAVCGVLSFVVVIVLGAPQNLIAGIALTFPLMLAVLAGCIQKKLVRRGVYLLLLSTYVYLFFPWESDYYHDLRADRHGVNVYPDLLFGRNGGNTELIQKHLGYRAPEWHWLGTRSLSFGFGRWRDGVDFVDSFSLTHQEFLPQLLDKLPDDDARVQALRCVTERKNLLRVHQGLLLTCIYELGYPPGHDAKSWWNKHSNLFQCNDDPDSAASMVAGWRVRIEKSLPEDPYEKYWAIVAQLSAARYAEDARWGGDESFGKAYEKLRDEEWINNRDEPSVGLKHVDWWPEQTGPHFQE